METLFRLAESKDLIAINSIYNQAIEARHQTADLELYSIDQTRKWFEDHMLEAYPVFVLELNGKVVGWSSLGAYRNGRPALSSVAEISYYIEKQNQGRGFGSVLITDTLTSARTYGFKTLVAILLDSNIASKSILKKFGFKEWGRMPLAANIDGNNVDHLYYGKRLLD